MENHYNYGQNHEHVLPKPKLHNYYNDDEDVENDVMLWQFWYKFRFKVYCHLLICTIVVLSVAFLAIYCSFLSALAAVFRIDESTKKILRFGDEGGTGTGMVFEPWSIPPLIFTISTITFNWIIIKAKFVEREWVSESVHEWSADVALSYLWNN